MKKNAIGLISLTEDLEQEPDTYLKLFILLYADDTVILAESIDDMQNQINYFYDFCMKWRLKVNIEKSKVLIFFRMVAYQITLNLSIASKSWKLLHIFLILG